MNVVKCKNGHFYDDDSFEVCPHCGAEVEVPSKHELPQKKKSIFGQISSKIRSNSQSAEETNNIERDSLAVQNGRSKTSADLSSDQDSANQYEQKSNERLREHSSSSNRRGRTMDFWDVDSSNSTLEGNIADGFETPNDESDIECYATDDSIVSDDVSMRAEEQNSVAKEVSQVPLRDAIKKASATSAGKTLSYFSSMTNEGSKGAEKSNNHRAIDPVVGWLISIKGNHLGESFCIYAGANSVGRDTNNRIVLSQDSLVSRVKHAIITYEPKHRNFYIKPGESSGLTYVNEEYISETKQIVAGDIVELGESQLMFIPLCGESFSWERYIKE
ncbi:MAG: FHA domain-containing protein [Clostridiales bacterium]|nr:FHA domain-containing protein [Candidatus Scatonaster coprocaballi]